LVRTFRATGHATRRNTNAGVTEAALVGGMHIPDSTSLIGFAIQTIELARPLVAAIARRDRDLASQVRRALSSVVLNLAEGFGSVAGNARLRFESARGSLYEAQAGLRVAVAWRYFTASEVAPVLAALDRLGARVYGLVRR
jgi:four helix bundle protein